MKQFYTWMLTSSKHERLIYAALWLLLFAAPVLSMFIRVANNAAMSFDWEEVWVVWRQFSIFLALFIIHDFLLAPLLIYRNRRMLYLGSLAAMVALFIAFQCSHRPDKRVMRHDMPKKEMRRDDFHALRHADFHEDELLRPEEHRDFQRDEQFRPQKHENFRGNNGHRPPEPPTLIFGQHDIISIIILIMMLGINLGIKYFFKTRGDAKQLIALEKQNLEQQLEYLKYQINPHFFMNTLNNIHALVDIDPEKAKHTILELSKMMRFVLYEGNKNGVPLTKEFDFIRNYVTLMQLRYTDKVKISVSLPAETPNRELPPLMLITFVENAFKHGISYQHESFIDVKIAIAGNRLLFSCRNSKGNAAPQKQGGVGLANVKQRLQLLYGKDYTLNIQDEADIYNVELNIPLI